MAAMDETLRYSVMDSPVGPLLLAGRDGYLTVIDFQPGREVDGARAGWHRDDAAFADTARQLREYFAGGRKTFDLPLAPAATPFQTRVLQALARIPYGETRSYLDIARAVGNPKAVRAVGAANGANPIAIVIPCHRVIGSDGSLTGFGGGLEVKRWLLAHESNRSGLFADPAAG